MRGRCWRSARMSSGVVGISRSSSTRSSGSEDFVEAFTEPMSLKVPPDLTLVNAWEVQEETEILLISECPVGVILQRHDLEGGEVLGAGDRNVQAAGTFGLSAGGEKLLGRLSPDVDEVQVPPGRIGVGMVRISDGPMEGLISPSRQPLDERVLSGKVDDQIQIQGGPGKTIDEDGDPSNHGRPGALVIE